MIKPCRRGAMARKPAARGGPAGRPAKHPTALQRSRGLVARRKEVRLWLQSRQRPQPANVVGLALSGGGIRSATFSLGLLQALAKSKRDALSRIDVLSTVSGGGYIGCFLRSLFLPSAARGIT